MPGSRHQSGHYHSQANVCIRSTARCPGTTAVGAEPPRPRASSRSAHQPLRSLMAPIPPAIRVNRAPGLTFWSTVVAERLGYPPETALTLGRFVVGSSARAKARRLGIIEETQDAEERRARGAEFKPRRQTPSGTRRPAGRHRGAWHGVGLRRPSEIGGSASVYSMTCGQMSASAAETYF
jgi:hypothetical protein